MSPNNPRTDSEVLTFGQNFCKVAETRKTEIGLSDTDLNQLTEKLQAYDASLRLVNTLKLQLAAAIKAKEQAKQDLLDKTKKSTSIVNGTDGVPVPLKTELGITVRPRTRSPLSPAVPADLVANVQTDGSVELYWTRNGNRNGTLYFIEMQADQATGWNFVEVTTKTGYLHKEPPPAVDVKYRVSARRRSETSSPSNTATATLRRPVMG